MLRPFFVIGVLSTATGALADPVPLANDELKRTVSGSTVEIDTPLGSTVPMRFGPDGLVSAEAGVLAPVLGSAKDRGRWWVDGDKLCTKWFRWFDAGVRCLTIAQDGARIHWRKIDDGETGTGTLINWTPPAAKKAFVAKADAPPAKKPEPERETRATTLAAPPRESPTLPPAAEAPTLVARADPSSVADDDASGSEPAMRFGGAGLLGASALAGPVATAADTPPTPPAPETRPEPQRPPAKLATHEAKKKDPGPPAKAARKVALQRQASLQAAAPAKPAPQKRPPAREDWEGVNVATSANGPAGLYRVRGVAEYDVLNVRRGPSEQHVSIASIPPTGRRVEIIGQCRADWCPIRYGGITGWVNSYYLAEDGSRQGSASPVYRQR